MIQQRSERVQAALACLRSRGERVTPARIAVLEVLDAATGQGHLDAESLVAQVGQRQPYVHRATVYRTLQSLTDLGLLTHTHVPGAATIYHLDVGTLQPHAHAQCTSCQRFVDLPLAALQTLAESVCGSSGFRIDLRHAALLGECRECHEAAAEAEQ